jgi:hypothetical protein
LQTLKRGILQKSLMLIYPLQVSLRKTVLQRMHWRKDKQKEEPPKKVPETKRDAIIKEVEKTQSSFSFESEMEKIKNYVPFNELIRNVEYRSQIIKMLKMEEASDTLNVQDDHPAILFGPQGGRMW